MSRLWPCAARASAALGCNAGSPWLSRSWSTRHSTAARTRARLLGCGVRFVSAHGAAAAAEGGRAPTVATAQRQVVSVSASSGVSRAWATAVASTPARADMSRGGQVWTLFEQYAHAPTRPGTEPTRAAAHHRQARAGGGGVQAGLQVQPLQREQAPEDLAHDLVRAPADRTE